jgi:hypothetical protein
VKRTPFSITVFLTVAGALVLVWALGVFGPGPFWERNAAGNVPPGNLETRIQQGAAVAVLEEKLVKLGFEPDGKGHLGIRFVRLKDLCAVLGCRPEDFKIVPGTPDGAAPPSGDFGALGGRHLDRPHFHSQIWLYDPEAPADLGQELVQAAVFIRRAAPE